MGLREKRLKYKEEFRREILEAARELFSSDGYEYFSMRRLARKIGYSPTTIYLYFRDKDDLLFNISEAMFAELLHSLEGLRDTADDPLEILRKSLIMYVEFGIANPSHYRVAFFTSPHIYGLPQEYLEKDTMSRRAYLLGRELARECMAAGKLRTMDDDLLAQVLWLGVHGIVTAHLFTADFPLLDPGCHAETLVGGLLQGLSP